MPVPLDPGDRKILIFAGLLLVGLVVASFLAAPVTEQQALFPSTYFADSNGAKAAYLLLKELDYDVERWERPPTELPEEAAGYTLILAKPLFPSTSAEQQAVRRFVRRGGRLLAVGPMAGTFLPPHGDEKLKTSGCGFGWNPYPARTPSTLAVRAPTITMAAMACWDNPEGRALGVYGQADKIVVLTYYADEGQVVWWAGSTPLTNAGIGESHNLRFFLNSVGPANQIVLWDEYYHGHRGTLATYIGRTPLVWGLAQLGLVLAAVCFAYSRRSGPLRQPPKESRLSPLEYIETLGDLYRKAQAAAAAVEIAYQGFRLQLVRSLGVPARSTPEAMYRAAVRRLGRPEPEFLQVMQRCERAGADPALTSKEAVFLVQALHGYARMLRLTNPRQGRS